MNRRKPILLGVCVVLAAFLAFAVFKKMPTVEASFVLLNEAELEQFRASGPPQADRSIQVTNTDGPAIKVVSPSGFSLTSPVDFEILLSPKSDAALDIKSLRIEYRLGPAWIDLTNRVMKYAAISGNRFYARGAELPRGRHLLRVSVSDTKFRKTQALVKFSVNK